MKYLSESSILESWKQLVELGEKNKTSLNKFFGVLELLQQINLTESEIVKSNIQFTASSGILSNSLQNKYFFDSQNIKNYTSQETLSVIFPNNWIENILQNLLKNIALPLNNVAIISLQNNEFENSITEADFINIFINKLHLKEASNLFFSNLNNTIIEFSDSKPSRQSIFNKLKREFNLTDKTKFTFGFDKNLITANPGELTRGPFIQPLYSGQENLKCLLLANFNVLDYYQINSNSAQRTVPNNTNLVQKIFYGAPGTGKSHKVKELASGKEERTERVTFHPEYDYNGFVGGYKPTMKGDDIRYEFVPQAFTNIYVKAWNDLVNDYYLVIEEINRGNCAEIFGDIFQLLDRTNEYHITPSKELKEYLTIQFSGNSNTNGEKLVLPPNLNILATMNTSDQSLFPMDSAFKRRWDWEYVPINDSFSDENISSKYKVKLSETERFSWLSFILSVNSVIKQNDNLGMDKCLGNYFIKPIQDVIDLETFINKAIFYLWNDVFKDEMEENNIFINKSSYEDFFPIQTNGIDKVKGILNLLKVEISVE